MRALIQRVSEASVRIDGKVQSHIGQGFLILLGIGRSETDGAPEELAARCSNLRVFGDDEGRMNRSLKDISGEALVISQFTLYADTRKGNRPGFNNAAPPEEAEPLYNRFVAQLRSHIGENRVGTGVFGAMMEVSLVNDGPVTIILDSREEKTH